MSAHQLRREEAPDFHARDLTTFFNETEAQ